MRLIKNKINREKTFNLNNNLKTKQGGNMIKNTLKIVSLACALIITIGFAKVTEVDAAVINGTTTSNINVRTGASTKYKSIGKIKKGKTVKILSSKNGWYQVQYSNTKGWSSSKYIKKSTTSSNVKKTLKVKAYAYTGGGYTFTGTKAKYGTLDVDPKVIPYGTKVYIKELDKVFTAEDCGGGIKGNTIDIYMNTQSACKSWGVRNITLEILK